MNPKTENNPYLGFVYTSFQERATKVSHGNTARFALEEGDPVLAKICGSIAADEGRHEIAYTRIVDQLWEVRACAAGARPANLPFERTHTHTYTHTHIHSHRDDALTGHVPAIQLTGSWSRSRSATPTARCWRLRT
jgi:hypothetical protein